MLRQETICRLVFCLLVFVLQIFCWVNFTVLIFYINHIIQILCQFLNLFLFEGILHGYLSLFVHTVFSVWYDFKAELSVTGFCAWSQGIYVEHLPKKKNKKTDKQTKTITITEFAFLSSLPTAESDSLKLWSSSVHCKAFCLNTLFVLTLLLHDSRELLIHWRI